MSSSKSSSAKQQQHKTGSHGSTSRSSHDDATPPASFLFVVNELIIDYDNPDTRQFGIPKDDWHNYLPPRRREQYATELPSEVMRFRSGRITRASADHIAYS
ncbi:hypothetical protein E4U41_007178, partial [Claviceps citrina]